MKRLKLVSQQVTDICMPVLKDIEANQFQWYRTRGGNIAIVLFRASNNTDYPLIGIYYTGSDDSGEWIPLRWTSNGKFSANVNSPLDLDMTTIKDIA